MRFPSRFQSAIEGAVKRFWRRFFFNVGANQLRRVLPWYSVTILSDGSVHYEGKAYVHSKAPTRKQISVSDVNKLIHKLRDEDFFHWEEKTGLCVDYPEVRIRASLNGQHKLVLEGCSAPGKVLTLAEEVDTISGTKSWVRHVDHETDFIVKVYANRRVTADPGTLRALSDFSEREHKGTRLSRGIIRHIRHDGQVKLSTMQRVCDFLRDARLTYSRVIDCKTVPRTGRASAKPSCEETEREFAVNRQGAKNLISHSRGTHL